MSQLTQLTELTQSATFAQALVLLAALSAGLFAMTAASRIEVNSSRVRFFSNRISHVHRTSSCLSIIC